MLSARLTAQIRQQPADDEVVIDRAAVSMDARKHLRTLFYQPESERDRVGRMQSSRFRQPEPLFDHTGLGIGLWHEVPTKTRRTIAVHIYCCTSFYRKRR